MTYSDRYEFQFPDQAGYPDESGTLTQDQVVLIEQVIDDTDSTDFAFQVVNVPDPTDAAAGAYEAIAGAIEIGSVPYRLEGQRVVILDTFVHPEHRRQGVATNLIRRVLDDIRTLGRTVTLLCPITRTFVHHHPAYADLIDQHRPGLTHREQPDPSLLGTAEARSSSAIESEASGREQSNSQLIAVMQRGDAGAIESRYTLDVLNDAERGRWIAVLGADAIGEINYRFVGGRVVLISTWVNHAFRHQRVATELIARALAEIRDAGKTITIICPVVGEFIARNPQYRDLIDPVRPGAGAFPGQDPELPHRDRSSDVSFDYDLA